MKIGIYGYGNLGRGVELSVRQNDDVELVGVFSRRAPETVKTYGAPVYPAADVKKFKDEIDVMILCAGSATDVPEMTPMLAADFNVVDAYDTHADFPKHYKNVDEAAKSGGKLAIIACGWDPGMFSINRLFASAVLPKGTDYTFWGVGVSQGHSDAIRRIAGVKDARQYTCPIQSALDAVRRGEDPVLTTREKHTRLCYVVAEEGADLERIENEIKTMPKYFSDYDTTVNFISQEELDRDHHEIPHGGFVIRSGCTGLNDEHKHVIEYNLKLDSNPEFTASVLVAYARAAFKKHERGEIGCRTSFDVAPAELSAVDPMELIAHML
ncbi:MAG: diaminopimelate dehydrogenase [Oscillospiraceae bacterium]|nr:diaminopimelate dehydrogenase [Oscillospiraceae bacterium]